MPDDPNEEVEQIDPADMAALRAELAATKLDNAMLEAGIDLASPTGKMFRKAWDGDPDVEKIKTSAAEIPGAIKPLAVVPAEGDGEDREPGEDGQFKERAALTNEAPAGAEDPDPKLEAWGALDAEIARGARSEDAMGTAMQMLVSAANKGDTRVLAQRNPG